MKFFQGVRRQGLVLLAATIGGGFFNYLFNMAVGRLLGPESYSVVSSLFALMVILSISGGTIQIVVARHVAKFQARGEHLIVKDLVHGSLKRMVILGVFLCIGLSLGSRYVAEYLKIASVVPVLIISFLFLTALMLPVNRGALQGLENFNHYAINMLGDAVTRFLVGIGLVVVGFGVNGALVGVVLGPATMLALSFWSLKLTGIFGQKTKAIEVTNEKTLFNWGDIYRYSWPVMLAIILFSLLTNSDLIFVKHFFGERETGYYAAAEIIGKIVLFVPTGVISIIMFPKATVLHVIQKDTLPLLKKSILATLGFCGALTIVYFCLSRPIMNILYGSEFLPGAPLLGIFGIAMTMYTLVNVLLHYFLSQRRFTFIYPVAAIVALQIALIQVLHTSLAQVVWILTGCSTLLCISMLSMLIFRRSISSSTA